MSKTYKFEIRVQRDDTSSYNQDGIDRYVETIEVESTQEAIGSLENYRLVVVPAGQD